MSTEIAIRNEETVAVAMRRASDVAGVCREIVTKTVKQIGPKKYVCVEGWQAIATAHNCIASARDVERIENGFRAIGEIRRLDTMAVIATAEGFVGDDEPLWSGRPEYAKRAMAQTRAISRACRSAFAHVVVMMNAGLETTPAEEIPHDEPAQATEGKGAHNSGIEICHWKKSKAFGKRWDELPTDEIASAQEFAASKKMTDLAAYLASLVKARKMEQRAEDIDATLTDAMEGADEN